MLKSKVINMSPHGLEGREKWLGKRNTDENPIKFLMRVYKDLLIDGLRRSDVEKYDKRLVNALKNDGLFGEACKCGLFDQAEYTDHQASRLGISTEMTPERAQIYTALAQRFWRKNAPTP